MDSESNRVVNMQVTKRSAQARQHQQQVQAGPSPLQACSCTPGTLPSLGRAGWPCMRRLLHSTCMCTEDLLQRMRVLQHARGRAHVRLVHTRASTTEYGMRIMVTGSTCSRASFSPCPCHPPQPPAAHPSSSRRQVTAAGSPHRSWGGRSGCPAAWRRWAGARW